MLGLEKHSPLLKAILFVENGGNEFKICSTWGMDTIYACDVDGGFKLQK
jgi:hypothetical protein